ncbi:MAG: protein phosphatase 2C domain-containing protein [Clostridia bacterium]|nr:protein phosphatase 2C domain-containing protein [Clostridia bacterium]
MIYRSFSCCARGASHIKDGVVCQDTALDNAGDNDGRMSVAVVADGHGSSQYFRSDIGSQKAAEAALNGIRGFIAQNPVQPEPFINNTGEKLLEGLAKNIIATWYSAVEEHEQAHPFAEDDKINLLDEKHRNKLLDDPDRRYFYRAYGTTLIAAAITQNYWFGLQIGDGKCVVLFDDGSWEQPIPWDDKCFLNATTSICDDDAISEFRYWYGPISNDDNSKKPVALFVASDGVDDTFPVHENAKYLKHLYRSVALSFAANGFDNTTKQIKALVKKMAEKGSRDDVSIAGIICDMAPYAKMLADQDELEKAADSAANLETARKKAEAAKLAKTQTDLQNAEAELKRVQEALQLAEAQRASTQAQAAPAPEQPEAGQDPDDSAQEKPKSGRSILSALGAAREFAFDFVEELFKDYDKDE